MSFVEFTGPARLDRRTKHLVAPARARTTSRSSTTSDIDRVSAEELLESGVRVVVNVAPSQTGRFPNPGPLLLVRGGVRLIDAPGAPLFDERQRRRATHRPRRQRLPQRHAASRPAARSEPRSSRGRWPSSRAA